MRDALPIFSAATVRIDDVAKAGATTQNEDCSRPASQHLREGDANHLLSTMWNDNVMTAEAAAQDDDVTTTVPRIKQIQKVTIRKRERIDVEELFHSLSNDLEEEI